MRCDIAGSRQIDWILDVGLGLDGMLFNRLTYSTIG